MPRRHLVSAGCAAVVVLFGAVLSRDARAEFQNGEFITYTQASWGDPLEQGGMILIAHYNTVYISTGGELEVGIPGSGGFSIIWTGSGPILDSLPSSGAPAALTADYIDPAETESGIFGGEVTGVHLNIDFSDAGFTLGSSGIPFGDLIIHDYTEIPQVNGLSVRQVLGDLDTLLGGGSTGYGIPEAANLAFQLNFSFFEGVPSLWAQDHLMVIPEPSAASVAAVGSIIVMLACRRRRVSVSGTAAR